MDQWKSFPIEFNGGLISNLPPLQHGMRAPGSARILQNFEPSVSGGYRRIKGYEKFDDDFVPIHGEMKVQGSGQTGTSINVANVFNQIYANTVFSIDGVTGTYTVNSSTYDEVHRTATLIISPALSSSPADKANIIFENTESDICGLTVWNRKAYAIRDGHVYSSDGTGWTNVSIPNFGTSLVNGAGQTGSTLIIDGLTQRPHKGSTFYIDGVEQVYTVVDSTVISATESTLTIWPTLSSSPADNAAITWLSIGIVCQQGDDKIRFEKYSLDAKEKLAFVDHIGYPVVFTDDNGVLTNYTIFNNDLVGASFIRWFKNQLFVANNNSLYFSSPYTDTDFTPANGAGVIAIDGNITGLVVFREALYVFTEKTISQITGDTAVNFALQPVTRKLGCVESDTIQEFGGDIIFLSADGLRLLSATARIGDINMNVVTKSIQKEITNFMHKYDSFSSVVVKSKSQYRLFGFSSTAPSSTAAGYLCTQKDGNNTGIVEWSNLIGIDAYVTDGERYNDDEIILFANMTGYVYRMEFGNSFDGKDIHAVFATPYVSLNEDPRIRKTFYKSFLYTDPEGALNVSLKINFDFDDKKVIQPSPVTITANNDLVDFYNDGTYGISKYGDKLAKLFPVQLIGSGKTASLIFESNDTSPPYGFDAVTIEYSSHDRR